MKARTFRGMNRIHQYEVGDLFLEVDRSIPNVPIILKPMGGPPAKLSDETTDSFLQKLKASNDDYPALKDVLRFLKFSPEDVDAYYEAIAAGISMAASCSSIIGAVITIVNLINDLFGGDKEKESLFYLRHISQRVDQIYGFLANQAKRGLYDETVAWRGDLENVRNAVKNARVSRSPANLDQLVALKAPLDSNLLKMCDPRNGYITFLRSTYGYQPIFHAADTGHWIDCAVSPTMTLADGGQINYRDPASELQTTIWDPAHYLDMLSGCLQDRLLLVAVTEPAFRSTNYDRHALENLLSGLTAFLNKWRASLIVANPLVGLQGGGHLYHPNYPGPFGIPIGAVDPVTGVSFYNSFWFEGAILETWEGSVEARGLHPDYSTAKDPAYTFKRAMDIQPRLLEGAIRASGIGRFADFRVKLQDILAKYSTGSDFVDLPNATFHLVQMNGPAAQVENVSLGFVGKYSRNPEKMYPAQRYTQTIEKRFRFAMPLRTDVSLIQLGYRMRIADRDIQLIEFSRAPGAGAPVTRFPTQPISQEIRIDDWTIYDVYQSNLFSAADEDRFEGVEPSSKGPTFLMPIKAFPPERIFLNERRGPVAFKVDVTFETDYENPDQLFVGHANVVITNIDPVANPGGVILPVTVYETRVGLDEEPEEVPADNMTIHVVPSFLVVGRDYFTDRREGLENMNHIFGDINERFAISIQPQIPIGPEWQVQRRAVEEVVMDRAIRRLFEEEPEVGQTVMRRFMPPTPVRDPNDPNG